jgi:hypothetical protein
MVCMSYNLKKLHKLPYKLRWPKNRPLNGRRTTMAGRYLCLGQILP